MAYESILFEQAEGVATVTLNRPDKLNAFTAAMHRELAVALDRIARDRTVRAVLLTGAGRGFCSGQDLADPEFPSGADADLGAPLDALYNPLVRRLRALDRPVVCAVNGVAAGAGANIALACDIVLAARSAKFIQAFCRIGLVPDSGGTVTLTRLAGEARAKGMALLGEPITADQALAWGLIWQVVEDADLPAAAGALAARLAAAPTRALALTKRAIHAAATTDMDAQLDLERDLQREAGQGTDYREGLAAFLEKRPPVFTGR